MKVCLRRCFVWLFALALAVAPAVLPAVAAQSRDEVVIVLSGEAREREVTVEARLVQNAGISGLCAEISYNAAALTLVGVERGEALGSLEYLTTNPDTERGYAATPFRLLWSGDADDASTGTLARLRFRAASGAPDGTYAVTLKSDGATCLSGAAPERDVAVDGVRVTVKRHLPEAVVCEISPGTGAKKPPVWPFLCGGAALTAALAAVFIKRKG